MAYDVMNDIVVKAGIRDRMVADLRDAMNNLANWPAYATEHGFSDDVAGAQEYAETALRRFAAAWKTL
jgi:hypothetical protein